MKTFTKISFLFILILFSACNSIKHLENDEFLITESKIKVDSTDKPNSKLQKYTSTAPNSKIFGIPLKLHIYNLAKQNPENSFDQWRYQKKNREKKLQKWLSLKQVKKLKSSYIAINEGIKKSGEAPKILQKDLIEESTTRLENWYWNQGYFNAEAAYDVKRDTAKQKAKITYHIKTKEVYKLDSIYNRISSKSVDSVYIKILKKNSYLKKGDAFKTENFEKERNRITDYLRNRGFYHFEESYISFYADTINTDHKVNSEMIISNPEERKRDSTIIIDFKPHRITEVNVFTDIDSDVNVNYASDSIQFENYNIYSFGKMKFKPSVIADLIFIKKDSLYKDNDNKQTYNRISNTRIFKYPSIQYIDDPEDSTGLIANVFLTPKERYSLNLQADVTQSNIQEFGIGFNSSVLARNLFRNAETLELSGRGNFGSSKDASSSDQFFDIFEFGTDLRLSFPKVIFPIKLERIITNSMSPFTSFSIGYSSQKNIGLDRTNFNLTYNINWKPIRTITHNVDVASIQLVNNLNVQNYFNVFSNSFDQLNNIAVENINQLDNSFFTNLDTDSPQLTIPNGTDGFISQVNNNQINLDSQELTETRAIIERKERLTENNLIVASNYTYNFSTRKNIYDNEFSQFRARIELSGNLLSLLAKPLSFKRNKRGNYNVFDVQFSQYIKPELTFIKHWDLSNKNIIATRAYAGIAIPLGNSESIPFSKSFFGGGPNDNRGWRPYDLGPGKTNGINEFNDANFKLSFNAEYRFNLFGGLNSALFVDVGNIWNVLDNVKNPDARFDGLKDLQDLSISSGFGLRYDLEFFVIRIDLGFKTYNPGSDGQKWFRKYNFGNAVYNFGINYPF
ncbi:MAG: BamA/TamA family outer membrane protein [Psychroflexus halocasei]